MKMTMIAAALVATAAGAASASTIRLDTTSFSSGSGGEFKATALTGFVGITGDATSFGGSTFQTFCLESHENFRPGQVYNVTLNTGAVSATRGFDALDARTAFLYTRFREGSLSGFDFSSESARRNSAGRLQKAIWYLEDESGGENNSFVALANAAIAVGGEWFGVGMGNVRVMNLSNTEFPFAQDQLTLITVPLPTAAAAGLAGFGLLATGRTRRRSGR